MYTLITLFTILFWNTGLKYYGPIKYTCGYCDVSPFRTILSTDYADLILGMLLPLFLLRKKTLDSTKAWIFPPNTNQRQLKGAILLGIAYFALFWMDYSGGENLSCKSDPL